MLRKHLKIAGRNFIHNKTFSAINVLGLALGLTSSVHEIADGRIVYYHYVPNKHTP
ncbi:hypothetical protein GCM10027592_35860 [Spirosoma flavus]